MDPWPRIGTVDPSARCTTRCLGSVGFHGEKESKKDLELTMWWVAPLSTIKVIIASRTSRGSRVSWVGSEASLPKRAEIRSEVRGMRGWRA